MQMEVEVSRRRFLQGSVAMTVVGGVGVGTTQLFSSEHGEGHGMPESVTTKTGTGEAKFVPTLCEMCVNKCAAIARVEDGVVTKLNPNPMFPKSKNMLCPRGNAGLQALYDPDRLKYPMIRVGEKGEGKFKRVSWEEAYDAILNGTGKFKGLKQILEEEKDNRSTIAFCAGEGMAEHTFKTFFTGFGSANWLNHASLCLRTVVSGYGVTLGAYPQADMDNAEYVIMAGANRAEAIVTPDTMDLFKRTKGRGAKLVCVDPRFTNTAAKADMWLPIKPGTDLAFVLALTYVALKEELYDKEYVAKYFKDFEDYKKHILGNNYTPEWASKITGLKAEDIYKVARDFMRHAPKAVYYPGRRSTFAKNDFQLRRAMAIYQALGGGIDTKGGLIFGKKLPLKKHEAVEPLYAQAKDVDVARSKDDKGYDDCVIVSGGGSWLGFRNRVLEGRNPYPVRGLFVYKHNPLMNMPNRAKTEKFMKMLDLVVTIDTMPSDTVMFADVVLPECTYLERTDPVKSFGGAEPAIVVRNKVIDPMFETKPVIEIMRGLTEKISRPLFEITKKYDEDVQDDIKDRGEEKVYADFNLVKPFEHSQEEINEHMVSGYPGAAEALKEHGVFYPDMDKYFKQTGVNEHEYYPEGKRHYSVRGGKPKTASGKVECNLKTLAEKGIDAMPTWRDEYEFKVPEGKFRLLTGRHAQFTQSGTANNAMLHDLIHENYIWINRRVAEKMHIRFGDTVEVSSSAGKVRIKAYPTEKIAPDQVFFIHGFGEESEALTWAYRSGGNDNAVIEDAMEPVYGGAAMHETNVEIRKV
jgi:thiosulfate reductase/polysulfide reductase chain A